RRVARARRPFSDACESLTPRPLDTVSVRSAARARARESLNRRAAVSNRRDVATRKTRRDAAITRAQRNGKRALASPGEPVPRGARHVDDDRLFALRDVLLARVEIPPLSHPRWRHEADEALKQAGVPPSDRRELMAALGFSDDE